MDETSDSKPPKSLLDDPRFVGAAMKSLYSSSSASVERGDQTRVVSYPPPPNPEAEMAEPELDPNAANPSVAGREPAAPAGVAPSLSPAPSDAAAMYDGPGLPEEVHGSGIRPIPFATPSEPPPPLRPAAAWELAPQPASRDHAPAPLANAIPFRRRDPEPMTLDTSGFETSAPSYSGAVLFWALTLLSFFALAYLLSP